MIIAGLILIAALGAVSGVVLFAVAMVRGLATRPDLITPAAYRDERQAAKPTRTGEWKPDKAWPFYPFRQGRADLARVWAEIDGCYQAIWKWPAGAFFSDRGGSPLLWWLLLPIPVAVITCLLAAGLAAAACFALFALVSLGCMAVIMAVFGPLAIIGLGAERTRRTLLRTRGVMPAVLSRDAPARLPLPGLLRACTATSGPGGWACSLRRCECGKLLPTMVLRAAWRLKAVCQQCRRAAAAGAGSRCATSGSDLRGHVGGQDAVPVRRPGQPDRHGQAGRDRRSGSPTRSRRTRLNVGLGDSSVADGTPCRTPATLPTALTCQLGTGTGHADAPVRYRGRHYQDAADARLARLPADYGTAWSTCSTRSPSAGPRPARRTWATDHPARPHAATGDPETAYGEVVARLRDSGVTPAGSGWPSWSPRPTCSGPGGLEVPDGVGSHRGLAEHDPACTTSCCRPGGSSPRPGSSRSPRSAAADDGHPGDPARRCAGCCGPAASGCRPDPDCRGGATGPVRPGFGEPTGARDA